MCVAQDVSSSDPKLNPPHTERAPNPLRRDLVVIPAEVAYNLRFVADNPGVWLCASLSRRDVGVVWALTPFSHLVHCHIEWVGNLSVWL